MELLIFRPPAEIIPFTNNYPALVQMLANDPDYKLSNTFSKNTQHGSYTYWTVGDIKRTRKFFERIVKAHYTV
jgi:hypothetical protein